MATFSDTIYNLVSSYTSDSQVELSQSQINSGADSLFNNLVSAHGNSNLTSNSYNYYSSLTNVTDSTLGLDCIPSTLRAKIKSSTSRFNFKNTVNNKYIILNANRGFLFSNSSDFDDAIELYNWSVANNVYGSGNSQIQAQYNSNFEQIIQNQDPL